MLKLGRWIFNGNYLRLKNSQFLFLHAPQKLKIVCDSISFNIKNESKKVIKNGIAVKKMIKNACLVIIVL